MGELVGEVRGLNLLQVEKLVVELVGEMETATK